jgi:hypothetical protein
MKYLPNKSFILLMMPLLLLMSCQSGPSEAEQRQALEDKVMAVHDEAMADMNDIYHLRHNLRQLRDSLEAQTTDTTVIHTIGQQLSALNNADDAMMGWMHQYQAPEKQEPAAAMVYLNGQLQKINKVKTQMDSTLTAASSMYNTYKHE